MGVNLTVIPLTSMTAEQHTTDFVFVSRPEWTAERGCAVRRCEDLAGTDDEHSAGRACAEGTLCVYGSFGFEVSVKAAQVV
jgi:hypothetical protein